MGFELKDLGQQGESNLVNPQQLINHLLLVWAIEYIEHSPTKHTVPGKPSDVIVVDCVDLDSVDPFSNAAGLVSRGCWWRQNRLIMHLKPMVGDPNPVLVKLIKVGQPYDFEQMKNDRMSVTRANNWFQNNPDFKPSEPKRRGAAEPLETVQNGATFHQGETLHRSPGPLPQMQETPLERAAREAAAPTSETLNRLRSMSSQVPSGPGLGPQDEVPPF